MIEVTERAAESADDPAAAASPTVLRELDEAIAHIEEAAAQVDDTGAESHDDAVDGARQHRDGGVEERRAGRARGRSRIRAALGQRDGPRPVSCD